MGRVSIEESTLTAIGNSIRTKTGKTDMVPPLDMPSKIESIGGDAIIKTVSGACPIVIEDCVEGSLLDYKIYGAEGGVGDKTKNLCKGEFNVQGAKFDEPIPAGTVISVSASSKGYDANDTTKRLRVRFFATDGTQVTNFYPTLDSTGTRIKMDNLTYTKDIASYWLTILDAEEVQIEIGSVHTDYEPYGYSVDVKVNDDTSKIYIKEQLGVNDYIDFENRKVVIGGVPTLMELPELPLIEGNNTFDVDTMVKPSNVELTYVKDSGAYETGYKEGYESMKLAVDMSNVNYRFNEEVTSYPSNWYRMAQNFTDANGVAYKQIATYTSSSKINIQYTPISGSAVNAYNGANSPMWADEAYRTIHIKDGSMIGDIETFRWLLKNGQFI